MRCVAVDWSGRVTGAAECIWIAQARAGQLEFLESGRDREAAIHWLIAAAEGEELVAGLDFSFSLPGWYCRAQGWRDGPAVWAAMRERGDRLLAAEQPPFWGRTRPRPPRLAGPRGLRATERDDIPGAKSTFQIGGAGAPGTGSLRGMALLPALAQRGFAIWPFDPPGPRTALELYPARTYPPTAGGRVVKTSWRRRHELLEEWFPRLGAPLRERAAGSQDAFDAAVSALVMDRHREALAALPDLSADPVWTLEGRAWTPPPPPGA